MSNPASETISGGARDNLVALVDRGASFPDISAYLDALDANARVEEVRRMNRPQQSKLWELAKGRVALDIGVFVDGTEKTVIYEGKNVLPLFSRFQKRFYRPKEGPIVGYNHNGGFTMAVAGPGYFITDTADEGEILFDYTRLPQFQPPGWPALKTNTGIIAGPVFGGMKDYIRYVARGTVIGAAFKDGKPRDQYFMLTRAP